jgi:endonuclease/exonuclease/phosphatase family metal-dependent hydrolase
VRPDRIVQVLREINADIIALQEVMGDHLKYIVQELGFNSAFGETCKLRGRRYGNVVLTRYPIQTGFHYDLKSRGRLPRGCLRTDIRFNGCTLHIFNVHLGTAFFEHRRQARRLFEAKIVNHDDLDGSRIVLGDFNEWVRGAVTRTMKAHLQQADIREHLKKSRTYPGVLPIFSLDHIYFDSNLKLEKLRLHKRGAALVASDHLPLVADFRL